MRSVGGRSLILSVSIAASLLSNTLPPLAPRGPARRRRQLTPADKQQCSNERPYCSNCANSGRRCEGYERERVFITGTPETKGRVASHPKKAPSSTKEPKPKAEAGAGLGPPVVPVPPLTPAWDDYMRLSVRGVETPMLLTALQTSLRGVGGHDGDTEGGAGLDGHGDGGDGGLGAGDAGLIRVSLPEYAPAELQAHLGPGEGCVKSVCLAALDRHGASDGYCAFLFEVDIPTFAAA